MCFCACTVAAGEAGLSIVVWCTGMFIPVLEGKVTRHTGESVHLPMSTVHLRQHYLCWQVKRKVRVKDGMSVVELARALGATSSEECGD